MVSINYGAVDSEERSPRVFGKFVISAVVGIALLVVVALVSNSTNTAELAEFPQTDLDMIQVMQDLNGKAGKVAMQQMNQAPPQAVKAKSLSLPQQYARIMQNMGYFAPWSRQNSWVDRVAIANIRKANTPQALAAKAEKIKEENAKFARKFSSPHTSQYTGKHESLSAILDPKYQPWANAAPRKAYYEGY